jgi:Fic family protein
MRTYEGTHPWLKFSVDLRGASPALWMDLGEIRSKCEHIAGVPLDGETAKRLYRLALTRGVQATVAIEGSTLSEEQVRQRIEGGLPLPASQEYLGREVDNIVQACDAILADVLKGQGVELTAGMVTDFNRMVLSGLPLQQNVVPGEIRAYFVGVGSYRAPPAEDCEYLLERMCAFINQQRVSLSDLDRISAAVLLSIITHLYIAWIHPFGDGNGRTARLVEFLLLLDGGVPAPAAHLLSNHYNLTRQRYYQELERASRAPDGVLTFLGYALRGFVEGLKQQLTEIRGFQIRMIWHDYVSSIIDREEGGESAAVRTRRRDLLVALSEKAGPVPTSEVALLNPGVARSYATRTRKTLTRDLNALRDLGLVELGKTGARARIEQVLAFLPPRKEA